MTKPLIDTWHWRLRYWVAYQLFRLSDAVNPRCFRKKDVERVFPGAVKPLFLPEISEPDRPTVH